MSLRSEDLGRLRGASGLVCMHVWACMMATANQLRQHIQIDAVGVIYRIAYTSGGGQGCCAASAAASSV